MSWYVEGPAHAVSTAAAMIVLERDMADPVPSAPSASGSSVDSSARQPPVERAPGDRTLSIEGPRRESLNRRLMSPKPGARFGSGSRAATVRE
jgi:hypothetical protein